MRVVTGSHSVSPGGGKVFFFQDLRAAYNLQDVKRSKMIFLFLRCAGRITGCLIHVSATVLSQKLLGWEMWDGFARFLLAEISLINLIPTPGLNFLSLKIVTLKHKMIYFFMRFIIQAQLGQNNKDFTDSSRKSWGIFLPSFLRLSFIHAWVFLNVSRFWGIQDTCSISISNLGQICVLGSVICKRDGEAIKERTPYLILLK